MFWHDNSDYTRKFQKKKKKKNVTQTLKQKSPLGIRPRVCLLKNMPSDFLCVYSFGNHYAKTDKIAN